jgi:hypothetical protein
MLVCIFHLTVFPDIPGIPIITHLTGILFFTILAHIFCLGDHWPGLARFANVPRLFAWVALNGRLATLRLIALDRSADDWLCGWNIGGCRIVGRHTCCR